MTKLELITKISEETGVDKMAVSAVLETFMETVKTSLIDNGEGVFLRGFGSFTPKRRATKTGRNISNNTTVVIPAHCVPFFSPAKEFLAEMSEKTMEK